VLEQGREGLLQTTHALTFVGDASGDRRLAALTGDWFPVNLGSDSQPIFR
jgi:hypothetical protein